MQARTLIAACCLAASFASQDAAAAGTWFDTLPTAQKQSILWHADHEAGNIAQWEHDAPWDSGQSSWAISDATRAAGDNIVHSGGYAVRSTIDTSKNQAGVRWPRRTVPSLNDLPNEAYYSAWFYWPTLLTSQPSSGWYMAMQWKSAGQGAVANESDPVWSINLDRKSDGKTYFQLMSFVGDDGRYQTAGWGSKASSSIPIAPGEWVHLEVFYRWSKTGAGAIEAWHNGVRIFGLNDIVTEFDYATSGRPRQWTVNAYGDELEPNPHTNYIDDAAISTERLFTLPTVGDFNGDGAVDAADYIVWRKYNGASSIYNLWRSTFGRRSGTGARADTAFAVPEVRSWLTALSGGLLLMPARLFARTSGTTSRRGATQCRSSPPAHSSDKL